MPVKTDRVWIALYKVSEDNKNIDIMDKAIALWTRGPYSHVELVVKDEDSPTGYTMKSFTLKYGYRSRPHTFDGKVFNYKMVKVQNLDYILEYSKGLEGWKYDVLGIVFSQILPLGIDHSGRMFCSEYVITALQLGQVTDSRLWYLKPEMTHPNKFAKVLGVDYR